MKIIIDKLIDSIKEKQSPVVMGIDPRYDFIPNFIKQKYENTLNGFANASIEFAKGLIDSVYDIIPAIKPQLAYFEAMGPKGLVAYQEIIEYAKSKGLIIISDGKK